MICRVALEQFSLEHLEPVPAPQRLAVEIEDADTADLPENERAGGIEDASAEQEVGRFEALTAALAGIDPQVCEETVFSGDAGKHLRREAFAAGEADGLVRGPDEDARMAIEGGDDMPAFAETAENAFHDLGVGLFAGSSFGVGTVERLGGRIQAVQPGRGDDIGDEVEETIRLLDGRKGLLGDLPGERQAGAHDRQRPLSHRSSPHVSVRSI